MATRKKAAPTSDPYDHEHRPATTCLPGESQLLTVEVTDRQGNRLVDAVACYSQSDWSIGRYAAEALKNRCVSHPIQHCFSPEAQAKFVGAWRWSSTARVLRASLLD